MILVLRVMPPNKALQRTAAPLGSRMVRENSFATVAADRAFPAAVAELGRSLLCHRSTLRLGTLSCSQSFAFRPLY